jgi:hypothetical protein
MLNWGNMIGWTNVASPHLRSNETGFGMDDDGSSWVGSTIAFGAIFGSIFAGLFENGTKTGLHLSSISSVQGWKVNA